MKTFKEDRYSTIRYRIRRQLDITLSDYAYCDIAYHLAASRRSNTPGWANASNSFYCDLIGITERGLRKKKAKLIKLELLERNAKDPQLIRTTSRWEQAHILGYVPEQEEQSSGGEEQSSGGGGTKFRGGRNKVPGRAELSSANSNKDIDTYIDPYIEGNTEPTTDWQTEILKEINQQSLLADTVKNRAEIFKIVEHWIDDDGFQNQWRFMNAGIDPVDPKKVLRDWVTSGNWYDVSRFNINKIRGWIRTTAKHQNNGTAQKSKETGENPFEYKTGSGQF